MYYPLRSLREGHWFKLICGASFQHLPAVRSLALAYALAGVDCIDVAADPAVISTAKAALEAATVLAEDALHERKLRYQGRPWLMVSFNDGEDPHFRKAEFAANECPTDCNRPCEAICPAQAIVFGTIPQLAQSAKELAAEQLTEPFSGVISDRCYGCGRCLPICPIQHISTRSYVSTPAAIAPLALQTGVDAIEIHTQVGRLDDFQRLWAAIVPWISTLKLISISCPEGDGLVDYLQDLYKIMSPLACPVIWQTDGRPMSGDIGAGATRAAVKLGQKVLAANLPGYVQLAGGTNHHTVPKLRSLGLLNDQRYGHNNPVGDLSSAQSLASRGRAAYIAGVAYGSYARSLLAPILSQLDELDATEVGGTINLFSSSVTSLQQPTGDLPAASLAQLNAFHSLKPHQLEDMPTLLWQAVDRASSLVSQLKAIHNYER